ncbi:thiamine pyrophosphate-binding protein [Nocardia sp. JMUB6875]|uniref:thiamine pyrophosphate-binding protein n=1 Tax=Nocardia sp. JMUB6875 TaxID=3158170 RepID=UPI0034E87825
MYRGQGSIESEAHTVADLIVDRIAAHTGHVFGVGGANIEDLYDALHRHPAVTGILAKHEFGAATMADGYSRATHRLGVVAATSGGGAMNLLAALPESFDSRVPVLALVGQPPTNLEGRGAFQDSSGLPGRLDAEKIFGAVSRYCVKVTSPQDISAALDRAIAAALEGGPSVLLLPKNIQAAPSSPTSVAAPSSDTPVTELSPISLADVPLDGSRAVVIAGPEVGLADARDELAALVRALGATVLVTPDAKDAFPNRDPLFAGVTGVMGHPRAPELVAEADLCLLVGAPLPVTSRAGLDAALEACPQVVYLGAEEPFVPVHTVVRGPLAANLNELAGHAGAKPAHPEASRRLPELVVPEASGPGVRYRAAVAALENALEPGTDVVVDAGNTGAAVVHHLRVPAGGRW